VNVKIIEIDGERRRLSLSLKRVEDSDPVQPRADGAESVHTRPQLDLSEEVFAEAPVTDDTVAEEEPAVSEPEPTQAEETPEAPEAPSEEE
jgi:small subunit ribosomal protein S1